MDDQMQIAQMLAALLKQHQHEIILNWVEAVHQLPNSPYRERPLKELRASVSRGLDAVIVALTTDSRADLRQYLVDTYLTRTRMGFDVREVVEVLLLCRHAVLPILWHEFSDDPTTARALSTQVDTVLCWMVSDITESHFASEGLALKAQQAQTAMVLDMVRVATSTLDLDQVLAYVSGRIATALGVEYCGFFLVDEKRNTVTPKLDVTIPALKDSRFSQGALSAAGSDSLNTLRALIRQVVTQRDPSLCINMQADPRFDLGPLQRLGLRSVLAIPFVVKERVVAVAFALTSEDCQAFTEEQVKLAHDLADAASLAIENARLYQQQEQSAVTQERARLSREIHDDLAPTLGALQLKASTTADFLAEGRVEEAQSSLEQLEDMISEAYTDVREEIFNLRARVAPGTAFLPALREYLDDYQAHYNMDIELNVDDCADTVLSGPVQVQVIRIIQESLTNVRKHASTTRACLHIACDDDHLRISVEDAGRGFDPVRDLVRNGHYVGLQVMCERAESIGGTLNVESEPGSGTVVVLEVPIALK